MKILYCGDSPAGGPANYLLAILRSMKAEYTHLSPAEPLSPDLLKKRYDAVILSDFSCEKVSNASQKALVHQVAGGTGMLMVGGWGSFSGPFAGLRGSILEEILPVHCLDRDDRVNFPGGALATLHKKHPAIGKLTFKSVPAICGLNQLIVKPRSVQILSAHPITNQKKTDGKYAVKLEKKSYPLLVADANPQRRVAALATDLAPHWCGGWVDWGTRPMQLPVNDKIRVEVGNQYVEFVSSLLFWLSGQR